MELVQRSEEIRRRLNALLVDDRPDPDQLQAHLRDLRHSEGIQAFSTVLHLLAHLRLPEVQAERLLADLLRHRTDVTLALGRDPGLRVAAIDYLSNVKKLLANPTIVERAQLEQTERSAITDSLTGLFNRRHFMSTLGLEVRRSRRYSLRLALLMLDLDAFKLLNDRHGHLFGDLVLQRVGQVLRRAVREADVACRYGGEEFAVILPETERLGAYALAERVRRKIEQRFAERPIRGQVVQVRLSGGIADYPEDGGEPAELIARADQALYLSKSRGKDRISLYHSERRTEIRYPVKATARARLAREPGDAAVSVQPINMSRGGVLVEAPDEWDPGAPVEIRFGGRDARGRQQTWHRSGRVVRVVPGGEADRGWRVAVEFEERLSEDCLDQQVHRNRVLPAVQGGRS